jgi:hypothetical protein
MRNIIKTQTDGSKNTRLNNTKLNDNTKLNEINNSSLQLILDNIFSFFKQQFNTQNKEHTLFSDKLIQKLNKLETQLTNNSNSKLELAINDINKNNKTSTEFIQEFVRSFNPDYLTRLNSTILTLNENLTQFIEKQSISNSSTPSIQNNLSNDENYLALKNEISQLNNNITIYGNEIKNILSNSNIFDSINSQLINIVNNLNELKKPTLSNDFSNLENILNNFLTKFETIHTSFDLKDNSSLETILTNIKTNIESQNTILERFNFEPQINNNFNTFIKETNEKLSSINTRFSNFISVAQNISNNLEKFNVIQSSTIANKSQNIDSYLNNNKDNSSIVYERQTNFIKENTVTVSQPKQYDSSIDVINNGTSLFKPTNNLSNENISLISSYKPTGISTSIDSRTDLNNLVQNSLGNNLFEKQISEFFSEIQTDYNNIKNDYNRFTPFKNIAKITEMFFDMFLTENHGVSAKNSQLQEKTDNYLESLQKENNVISQNNEKEEWVNKKLKKADGFFVEFWDNLWDYDGKHGHAYKQEKRRKKYNKQYDLNAEAKLAEQKTLSPNNNESDQLERITLTGQQKRLQKTISDGINVENKIKKTQIQNKKNIGETVDILDRNSRKNGKQQLLMSINKNVEKIHQVLLTKLNLELAKHEAAMRNKSSFDDNEADSSKFGNLVGSRKIASVVFGIRQKYWQWFW